VPQTENVLKEREGRAEARRAAVDRLGPRSGGDAEPQPEEREKKE
jgi:hypothetical protein